MPSSMRVLLVALLLAVAASASTLLDKTLPKDLTCDVCKASVEGVESTEGQSIDQQEQKILNDCFDFCDSILGDEISKIVCDNFAKSFVEDIVKYLEDPTNEDKSAEAICEFLGQCKSS